MRRRRVLWISLAVLVALCVVLALFGSTPAGLPLRFCIRVDAATESIFVARGGAPVDGWRWTSGPPTIAPDVELVTARWSAGSELLAVLVDPKVVDAILRHLEVTDQPTSMHARDPPAA